MIIRAKTTDLFDSGNLTEQQLKNSTKNKKEIEKGITELKSYPQRIVLELTNACNISCIMCGRNHAEFKPTLFESSLLEKFEDILNHVEEVTLIGWGEPTVYPKFGEALKYLNKFPVRKFICTNGMMLDKYINEIFDCNVDLITVSLDGPDAETNNSIRAGSNFDKIINNIKLVVSENQKRGTNYPYLSTVTTIMQRNFKKFPQVVKLSGELGLNEAKAVYLTAFSEEFENEALYNMQNDVRAVFAEATKVSEQYGLKLKLPYIQGEDIAGDAPHKDCYVAWRDLFISSDGYIRPCMSTPIKLLNMKDYDNFFDIWNNDTFKEFRKNVNSGEMSETCRKCYQASYANWNMRQAFLQTGNEFSPKWEK